MDNKKKLEEITLKFLDDNLNMSEIKRVADEFYDLLSSSIEFDDIKADNRNSIFTERGRAISPFEAAHCTKEFMRTKAFIKGIYFAIRDLKKETKNEPIRILYAGTGPFATLMLPMTSLYSKDEIQFTLIEINNQSVNCLEKVINHFGIDDYIDEIILTDATSYTLTDSGRHHILLTETMQQALRNEPQVSIALNLVPQIRKDGIIIPENIIINLGVINSKKDFKRKMGELVSEYYIELGNILEFNKAKIDKILSEEKDIFETRYFDCNNIEISKSIKPCHDQMNLMTRIEVYNGIFLNYNDCSLNLPWRIKKGLDDIENVEKFEFKYRFENTPQLVWNKKIKNEFELKSIDIETEIELFEVFKECRSDLSWVTGFSETEKNQYLKTQFELEKTQFVTFYPKAEYYMVIKDNKCIGRLYIDYGENDIRILEIGLIEKYRNRGIGRSIIKNIIAKASEHNKSVSLQVSWFNEKALKLYEELGFFVVENNQVSYEMQFDTRTIKV